jgi:hypothetical protein
MRIACVSEIGPENLEGDELIRWYRRSPADIEQARQAAAEKRYQDFFYGTSATDPDPGFARDTPVMDHDVDPGFAVPLPTTSQDVDSGFTWVQTGPYRFCSIRLTSDDPSAGWLSYGSAESSGEPSTAATDQDAGPSEVSASELDLTPQPISQAAGELRVPDAIKNQPWNIKPMPSAEVRGRITGPYKGKPQFNVAERYWYGTPAWSKVTTGAAVGHPLAAATAQPDQRR